MHSNAERKMLSILLVGLSHRTAPIDVREQLSLDVRALPMVANDLFTHGVQQGVMQEVVILSTCNRLEIYAVSTAPSQAIALIQAQITRQWQMTPDKLAAFLYVKSDADAINHLLRVASGLDSLILGEAQILGQVGHALTTAHSSGTGGPLLTQLFNRALHCGKRARAETPIGCYTTSISHAAVRHAESVLGDLSRRSALVIGAGKMAELAALALRQHRIASIVCINRTLAHAEQLAMKVGGRAVGWARLHEALTAVDLVISATAAPHIVLSVEEVAQALSARAGRSLLLFDIALPRDIEPDVDTFPDVFLYDIDHLRGSVDANLARRESAIPFVEAIVAQETTAMCAWLGGREVLPTVLELRRHAETIARQEVDRTLQRLRHQMPDDDRIHQEVERLAARLVAKLLHEPTVRLKAQAANGNGAHYAQALTDLFALSTTTNNAQSTVADLVVDGAFAVHSMNGLGAHD